MNRHEIGNGSKGSFQLHLSACPAAMHVLLDTPHLRPYTAGLRAACWRARVEGALAKKEPAWRVAQKFEAALAEEGEVGRGCCVYLVVCVCVLFVLYIDTRLIHIHIHPYFTRKHKQVTAGDRYHLQWKLRALRQAGGGAGLPPREEADEGGALCPRQVVYGCVCVLAFWFGGWVGGLGVGGWD